MKATKASLLMKGVKEIPTVLILLALTLWPIVFISGLPDWIFGSPEKPFFVPHDELALVLAGLIWMIGLLVLEGYKVFFYQSDTKSPKWWRFRFLGLSLLAGLFFGYRAGPAGILRNWPYFLGFTLLVWIFDAKTRWKLGEIVLPTEPEKGLENPETVIDQLALSKNRSPWVVRMWVFWPFYLLALGLSLAFWGSDSAGRPLGWIILFLITLSLAVEGLGAGLKAFDRLMIRRKWWQLWVLCESLGQAIPIFLCMFIGSVLAAKFQTIDNYFSEFLIQLIAAALCYFSWKSNQPKPKKSKWSKKVAV